MTPTETGRALVATLPPGIAAVTALAGQTARQPRVTIAGGRKAGLRRPEIGKVAWGMAHSIAFPHVINWLNAELEVVSKEDADV